jgi:hypothetical protein
MRNPLSSPAPLTPHEFIEFEGLAPSTYDDYLSFAQAFAEYTVAWYTYQQTKAKMGNKQVGEPNRRFLNICAKDHAKIR